MKILMLNYEFPPLGGGASSVTRELCREIAKRIDRLDVVTMSYDDLPRVEKDGDAIIYRVPSFRSKKEVCKPSEMGSYLLSGLYKCVRLNRKFGYDLVHAHFILPTGALAFLLKKLSGLPYIITSHGSDVPGYNPDRFKALHKMLSFPWKKIVNEASQLISPSKFLGKRIQTQSGEEVKIIPYGFYPDKIRPKKKKKQILLSSRLLPRKGFQHALKALSEIDLKDYEVKIAGEGPYKDQLVKLSQELDLDPDFLGWVEGGELHELYGESSIFIFPSQSENFPVVLMEAMAGGNAIITSNVTGCPEVVGEVALLVDPTDTFQIRKKVELLLKNDGLRQDLQVKARERLENQFSWSTVTEDYLKVYREVTSNKK